MQYSHTLAHVTSPLSRILASSLYPNFFVRSVSLYRVIGKVCIRAKWPIRPELIPVSIA